jgi:riboflavin synthase
MFTGIVEECGKLRQRDGGRFVFEASVVTDGLRLGDSLNHNGCCLTVVEIGDGWYAVDAVEETLRRTNLGDLRPGHVDGVGEIVSAAPDLEVRAGPGILRYLVEKGSVTVDGCSLTVVKVLGDSFTVAVIPHTAEVTTLGVKLPGDRVNLEVDVIAKYVERLLEARS